MSNNHNPLTADPDPGRALERHPSLARDARLARLRPGRRRPGRRRTDRGDQGLRLPAGRVGPRRRPRCTRPASTSRQTENVLINPRGHAALDSVAATTAAAEIRDGMRDVAGVVNVSQAQPNADRSALLISVQLARDQDDVSALQAVTKRVQADHPDLQVREAGDRLDRRQHQRPGRLGPLLRRGHQPAGHAGPDAARVRRADRRRHPRAARRHQRRRHHRHHRTALAPGARRGHRQQHDRADRDGRRGRLLAVLPQARARGTGRRSQHPRRRRDRRADLRPLDPGLGRSGDRLDGGPVRDRRRDLQLARHRRHPRGRDRGARLDHGAARAAGQARSLGRPARGSRCCGASTAGSAAAGSAAACCRRCSATRPSRWSSPVWSCCCWPCRRSG